MGSAYAQSRTVTGVVTDNLGQPLSNASIVVKGTNIGTTSGEGGKFSLNVPANTKSIVISAIGFGDYTQTLGSQNEFSIQLSTSDKNLSEVVIVGYGTQKKRELTTSVSQVKGTDL
jgi:hypothetical protein